MDFKMNANELADHLSKEWIKHEKDAGIFMKAAAEFLYTQATMLRQQQAEIDTLRTHGYKTQYELLRLEFLQQQAEIDKLKNLLLDNQILLDKTLNAWAKEMERKK